MTLQLRFFPDPILRAPTEEVTTFDRELHSLLDKMLVTMYAENGAGLAAPQIGVSSKIVVMDVSRKGNEPIELVNPVITARSGKIPSEEGCLSIPDYRDTISRSALVSVEAQNRHGEKVSFEAEGYLSVCAQHEIDHLNGILFIDHLSRLKRDIFKRWFKKHGGQV